MLLFDLSGIVTKWCINLHHSDNIEIDLDKVRTIAFSSLLYYKKKYSGQYGTPIICADRKPYWRESVHPYYKKNRDSARDKSGIDWKEFSANFKIVQQDIKEFAPYPFIDPARTEADDSIAVLTQYGCARREKVMIVSSDKDMIQLQRKHKGVKQHSPATKKLLTPANTDYDLLTHIVKGDSSDGIPNIYSPDDILMESGGARQKAVTQKMLASIRECKNPLDAFDDEIVARRFKRNRLLIDLDYIPERIVDRVVECYENETREKKRNRMMSCVRKYRLRNLLPKVQEF